MTSPLRDPKHPARGSGAVFQLVNHAAGVEPDELTAIAAACQAQARGDFANAWMGLGADTSVVLVDDERDLDPAAWWVVVADTVDAAGALGYHDVTDAGTPIVKIAAGSTRAAGESLSTVISHEILETLGDPAACYWVLDTSDSTFYALETADAVQSEHLAYEVDGVLLSDFVFPAFFDPRDTTGRFDHVDAVHRPLATLPGGYQIVIRHGRVDYVYGSTSDLPATSSRPGMRLV